DSGIGIRADKIGGTVVISNGKAVTGLTLGNTWNHIAWVTTETNQVIYVNGIVRTIAQSGSNIGYHNPNPCIGRFWDGNPNETLVEYFDGILDELRLWNRAL